MIQDALSSLQYIHSIRSIPRSFRTFDSWKFIYNSWNITSCHVKDGYFDR